MSSPKGGLRGGDHQDLRVLFLHELDSAPGSEKQRLLEKALGKQRVKAPNLKTRQTIMMFVLGFLVLAICLLSGIIAAAVLAKWYIGLCVLLGSAVVLVITYWFGGKAATHFMWLKAIRIAEKKFREQRSNVIVATSFGSVVALSMDIPKVPMLLLCPAHDQYSRFMRLRNGFTLHGIPYVLIVHGSGDKTVPLDDSIRLLETADGPGRSRLEVINDVHTLKSIKPEDLRQWVDEVFTQGKRQVRALADSGSKGVDPSLYEWGDEPEANADKEAKKQTENEDDNSSRGTSAPQEPTGASSV
ncbi:hypothetical protein, conserved [Eimeria necatrix]|uniref:Transmembrane protein n=1 Tax=Eimeria necatrix TaxID=51315 RepID=U6MZ52_9EIME|nr:hypothetical protein, conserved [Eimeria necatrix]CDJ69508.1 hypothetical protein, conserved [Eimeria necatrix]